MPSTSAFPGRGSLSSEKALRQKGTEADSWQLASVTTTIVRLEGKCTSQRLRLLHSITSGILFLNIGESPYLKSLIPDSPKTYVILLTNVTLVNFIKLKKIKSLRPDYNKK